MLGPARRRLTYEEIETAYMEFATVKHEPTLICVSHEMMLRLERLFAELTPYVDWRSSHRLLSSELIEYLRKTGSLAIRFNAALIRPFRFVDRDTLLFVCNGRLLGSKRIGVDSL